MKVRMANSGEYGKGKFLEQLEHFKMTAMKLKSTETNLANRDKRIKHSEPINSKRKTCERYLQNSAFMQELYLS